MWYPHALDAFTISATLYDVVSVYGLADVAVIKEGCQGRVAPSTCGSCDGVRRTESPLTLLRACAVKL